MALILLGGLSKLLLLQSAAGKSLPGDLLTRIRVWKDMDLKFSFTILCCRLLLELTLQLGERAKSEPIPPAEKRKKLNQAQTLNIHMCSKTR